MPAIDDAFRAEIDDILRRYPVRSAAMLPLLHAMQEKFGSLSDEVIETAAGILGVSPAQVHGVVSFYTLFRRPWEGRHTIWVCATLPCALRGAERLHDCLREKLKVDRDGVSPDRTWSLKKQECLAACDRAVCLQIDDEYYFDVTPERVDAILQEVLRKERAG